MKFQETFIELMAISGMAMVLYGVALIYQPLAWIAGGSFLIVACVHLQRPPRKTPRLAE